MGRKVAASDWLEYRGNFLERIRVTPLPRAYEVQYIACVWRIRLQQSNIRVSLLRGEGAQRFASEEREVPAR